MTSRVVVLKNVTWEASTLRTAVRSADWNTPRYFAYAGSEEMAFVGGHLGRVTGVAGVGEDVGPHGGFGLGLAVALEDPPPESQVREVVLPPAKEGVAQVVTLTMGP